MRSLRIRGFLALLGVWAVAACGESGAEPLFDDLTAEERTELEVLADEGSFEVALELSEATSDAAFELGDARAPEGRGMNALARVRFEEARSAMLSGEHRRALEAVREARRLVARALRATAGEAALEAVIERIEALALTADDDVFEDADALRAELDAIAADARALLAQGDSVEAAARALLGEQLARLRRWRADRPDVDVDRARLAVELAGSAVGLAERLVTAESDPAPCAAITDVRCDRNRWLRQAKILLALSERALEAGHLRGAVHLAEHAHWSALKAVLLPGGIQEEEIEAMVELANDLFAQAEAAIGDDATDLRKRLLHRAAELIEIGLAKLEDGQKRGVAALWRAAVICTWLLG